MNTPLTPLYSSLFVFVFLFVLTSPAQSDRDSRIKKAEYHAQMSNNGALLVLLSDSKRTMKELEKKGMMEKARKLRRELKQGHKEIVSAIAEKYEFSDYYFFYASNSDKIESCQLDGVLMNDSLQPIDSIPEFEPGTPKGDFYILDPYRVYLKDMNTHQLGFAVMDKTFTQLEDPFPYYVRRRETLWFLRRSYEDMARILNERLEEFYFDE